MDPKAEEKKVEATPQAPAEGKPDLKEAEKVEGAPKPAGLDALTNDRLRELYKKTPQLFEGIVKEEEKKPPEEKKEAPTEKPQSAAPVVVGGKEIKFPEDVPVDRAAMATRAALANELGLTAEQFQRQFDFEVNHAREVIKKQQAQKTPEQLRQEQDAENVALLKADKAFGAKYDENMEIARRAAVKFGEPELLERLKTSDPVLVKHLWKIGQADAEDKTPGAPNRNGEEGGDEEESRNSHLKQRYKNTPQMFD